MDQLLIYNGKVRDIYSLGQNYLHLQLVIESAVLIDISVLYPAKVNY